MLIFQLVINKKNYFINLPLKNIFGVHFTLSKRMNYKDKNKKI